MTHVAVSAVVIADLLTRGSPGRIELPCREGSFVFGLSESQISTPLELPGPEACPEELAWAPRWSPRTRLTGRVAHPAGALWLLVASCPSRPKEEATPIGRYPVELGEDRSFSADLPSGCHDVTMEAAGFAPVTWRAVGLPPLGTLDVGIAELVEGAVLRVRVTDADRGEALPGATVDLVDAPALELAVQSMLRGKRPRALQSSRTDERGWTELRGLALGDSYHLVVAAPGMAPQVTPPVVVREGEAAAPVDVELGRFAAIEIAPAIDLGALPDGLKFTANAAPFVGCRLIDRAARWQTAGAGDVLRFPELPPGRWRVDLSVTDPRGRATGLASRELDLASGASEVVDLGAHAGVFLGRVLLADEPVEARLRFTGVHRVIDAASDSTGQFSVLLPGPGRYRVHATAITGGFDGEASVEVGDPSEQLEIELSGRGVSGRVVDGLGPVAGAHVDAKQWDEVSGNQRWSSATTDELGHFQLSGLGPGTWTLVARADPRVSLRAKVEAARKPREVELELREPIEISGWLTTADGLPAAGARLSASAVRGTEADGLFGEVTFDTDALGWFSAALPVPEADRVLVQAFGSPGQVATFVVPPVGGLRLSFPPSAGGLRLRIDGPLDGINLPRIMLRSTSGSLLSIAKAVREGSGTANEAGGDLIVEIPTLPAGSWSVFEATPETFSAIVAGTSAGEALATIEIGQEGVQEVTIQPARRGSGE